jgi:two-component system, chemotaxis family, response regulator Rcp1
MNSTLVESRSGEILHVDDDDGLAELTREAFKRTKLTVNLSHTRDGEECMAFLRKEGKYTHAPTPDIILLDLNMPRKNGREVLEEISRDASLCHLPVVIFTTSQDEEEILKMYQLRCSSYMVKPMDFTQFVHTIESFSKYWLTVVVLPTAR